MSRIESDIPECIATSRLVLRSWQVSDAPRLKAALDANLEHLRAWMPWAIGEPSPLPVIEERLARFAADFTAGSEWLFGIFSADEETLIGGCGLHPRIGLGSLEIGYWVQRVLCRRGYATEAAGALTETAFAHPEIERLEIRCDPRNVASAGVPRRLGYRHVATLQHDAVTPEGNPRPTMVWELTRDEFLRS